jgi:hypothetical protein
MEQRWFLPRSYEFGERVGASLTASPVARAVSNAV